MKVKLGRRGAVRRRVLGVVSITATVAGLALWGIGPAQAVAQPVVAEGVSQLVGSENFKNATARCPGDTRVYGAAFDVTNGLGKVAVNTLEPSSDLRTVFVEANETDSGITSNWSVTAQAICGPAVAGLHRAPAKSTGRTLLTAQGIRADCDSGVTYGGGFAFPFGYGKIFLEALAFDTSLRGVTAQGVLDANATVPSGGWGVTAYAICGTRAATMEMVPSRNFTIDSNSPKTERISCTGGTHVHGVGVFSAGDTAARRNVMVDDMKVDNPAVVTFGAAKGYENNATTGVWYLIPEVICAS